MSPMTGRAGRRLRDAFDREHNNLNLVRLVLALTVLVDHSLALTSDGGHEFRGINAGFLAVFMFFGISGFLLLGSATGLPAKEYLRRRAARILPAFWVTLAVTAFVIAPGALVLTSSWCGAPCYLQADAGPLSYLLRNAGLWIFQPGIAGTPSGGAYSGIWNGSLWTLSFEFLCYLLLLGLAVAGIARRGRGLLTVWIGSWIVGAICTVIPALNSALTMFSQPLVTPLLYFVPVFLTGAVVARYAGQLPDSGLFALAGVLVFAVVLLLPVDPQSGKFGLSLATLAAPVLVYPVIWCACHMPGHDTFRRNDYSYGVYIYAFVVQQALIMTGFAGRGYVEFLAVTLLMTGALAVASWWLVERPVIAAVRRTPEAVAAVARR